MVDKLREEMMSRLPDWSIERITTLASDSVTAQAGRHLSKKLDKSWKLLGTDSYSAWAIFQGSDYSPYKVKVNLQKLQRGELQSDCNCRSYNKPCKHIMGLLFILVEQATKLSDEPAPDWVKEWLGKEAKVVRKQAARHERRNLSAEQLKERDSQRDKRRAAIAEGMNELEQWMINLIRRGLAEPQVRSYAFWDSRAARMIDAQAPSVAQWLREMGGLPARGADWIEPLLDELGRLYLLVESFKRFEALSPETQGDIRTALGWPIKRDELNGDEGEAVEDTWLVLGRYMGVMHERLRTQRIWLRGIETGRDALISEFVGGDALFETHLRPGWAFEGEMLFTPSRYPLRAFLLEKSSELSNYQPIQGESILSSIENYGYALSQNPWISHFPFLLDEVIPVRQGDTWILRELDGRYLPLAPNFAHPWSLLAISGGNPIQVAGEWDGRSFHPTGAVEQSRFVDFGAIGKL
jgi:hypothetical protein